MKRMIASWARRLPDETHHRRHRVGVLVVVEGAEPEGVEVDRPDAGRARASDVGDQRVADVDGGLRHGPGRRQRRLPDPGVGLADADRAGVDDGVDGNARPGPDLADTLFQEPGLDGAVGVGDDRDPGAGCGEGGELLDRLAQVAGPGAGRRQGLEQRRLGGGHLLGRHGEVADELLHVGFHDLAVLTVKRRGDVPPVDRAR